MAAFLDLCRFIPTAGGTTDWTFSSAVGGCQSPAAANAVNGTAYKFIASSSDLTQWEITEGAYNSAGAGSFARTTVLYNSSGSGAKTPGQSGAGTKINFSIAPQVAIIGIKEDLISVEEANSFTSSQQAQARSNIGISSQIGTIEWWPTSDLPASRLKADGGSYSRTTYADLFSVLVKSGAVTFTNGSANVGMTAHGRSVNDPMKLFTSGTLPTNFTAATHGLVTVGTVYYIRTVVDANTVTLSATPGGSAITAGSAGSGTHTWVCAPHGDGDGSTTFTVPDYRGGFLRALDGGAGVDTNRSVGSLQLDAMQGHIHSATSTGSTNTGSTLWIGHGGGTAVGSGQFNPASFGDASLSITTAIGNPTSDGTNGTPRTAAETRPRNVAALVTIRYAA